MFVLPIEYDVAYECNCTRLPLDGPMGWFFYLADRVTRQVYEDGTVLIPGPSTTLMLDTKLIDDGNLSFLIKGILLENYIPKVPEFET